jgi:hypothetical protein
MKSVIDSKRVVIWGHSLHSHTHSYIHYGFYQACKSLGYDVTWLSGEDKVDDLTLGYTEDITVDANLLLSLISDVFL